MIHQSSERVSEAAEIKTGTQFHLSATILTHTHTHTQTPTKTPNPPTSLAASHPSSHSVRYQNNQLFHRGKGEGVGRTKKGLNV